MTAAVSRRYFVVELLDPQLNFLDVKNHASLIVVSGRSSLEGQKDTDAILARIHSPGVASHSHPHPHSSNGHGLGPGLGLGSGVGVSEAEGLGLEPKRANELKLSMDGVSAFTVPTHASTRPPPPPGMKSSNMKNSNMKNAQHNLRNHHHHHHHHHHNDDNGHNHNHHRHSHHEKDEVEDDDEEEDEDWWGGEEGVGVPDDVVHWKVLDHTTNSAGRAPLKTQQQQQQQQRRPYHPHYPTSNSTPHSLALDALTVPLEWESPHLRMAVRDFQIKAQYSFWMDVTAKVSETSHPYP